MPRLLPLTVTDDERHELEAWVRRPDSDPRVALRSRIVLAAADGLSNTAIAGQLRVTLPTVGKWRRRFREDRLDGLADGPRPGAPRTITDARVETVINQTLGNRPDGVTHWNTRDMARQVGLSQSAIVRIWRAFELNPRLHKSFPFSTDPYFVEKIRDVVGLYLNPPDRAVVLSVDEKGQVPALDRTLPPPPMTPGRAERGTRDSVRNGAATFAALNVATGKITGNCSPKHRQRAFVKFLEAIDQAVPEEDGVSIHLIRDNSGTPETPRVKRWLLGHPRYVVHFAPTYSSRPNQVERFFARIADGALRRGAFQSIEALETTIEVYLEKHDRDPKPFVWYAAAGASNPQ